MVFVGHLKKCYQIYGYYIPMDSSISIRKTPKGGTVGWKRICISYFRK